MTKRSVGALGCAAFVMSLGAMAASGQSTDGSPAAWRAAATPFSSKPFGGLFDLGSMRPRKAAPPAKPLWRVSPRPRIDPEPTCGLIVMRPSPRLDPKFPKHPADAHGLFAMRTEPVLCR